MKIILSATTLMIGLLANLWWLHNPYLGVALLIPLVAIASQKLSAILPLNINSYRFFWAASIILLSYMLLGTLTYYLVGITRISSNILLLGLFIPISIRKKTTSLHLPQKPINTLADGLFIAAVLILAGLFRIVIEARTGDLLVSPWQAVDALFFILYAGGIAAVLWHNSIAVSSIRSRLLTSGYLFFAFSIAAIIFAHGFGFDGFIHRATELWIAENGQIDPITPYYIGQYSIVVLLHLLTGVSIQFIDIFFVPVIAALFLPSAVSYTAKAAGIPERYGVSISFIFPFLYYITLNLTTPHNVVLLFFPLTVLCLFAYAKQALPWWISSLFATAALVTHPLLGAPLWLFNAYVILSKQATSKKLIITYHSLFLLVSSLLPSIMFSFNNYRGGFGFPELSNPLSNLSKITSLFARPYWFAETPYPLLEILYSYQLTITPLFFLLVILGWWQIRKQDIALPLLYGTLSFWIAGAFLRAWLYFPNVAEAEQNNYPLRLFWASVLFLIPFAVIGIYRLIQYLKQKKVLPFLLFPIAIMLMLSLYFSYPQRNQKVHYPGYNVSEADVLTAQWIHNRHKPDDDYVVLANSLTSIAALTEYSFYKDYQTELGELFYYSIPTGGPLYLLYQEMLYNGQQRETMYTAMELTGASTSYFAVSYFWKNYNEIIDGAKKSANEWHSLADGKMHVFIYHRDTAE